MYDLFFIYLFPYLITRKARVKDDHYSTNYQVAHLFVDKVIMQILNFRRKNSMTNLKESRISQINKRLIQRKRSGNAIIKETKVN